MKRFKWKGYSVKLAKKVVDGREQTVVFLETRFAYRWRAFDFKRDCKQEFINLSIWLRRNESLMQKHGA